MTEQEIVGLLREALAWAQPAMREVAKGVDADTMFADLGIESLSLLEMAAFVEERLGVEFSDERLMNLTGVRQFIELIVETTAPQTRGEHASV
jgi:acyl carrier protein